MIAEALNQSYNTNNEEDNEDLQSEKDKEFYWRSEQIKYINGEVKIVEYISDSSDEFYRQTSEEEEEDNEDDEEDEDD